MIENPSFSNVFHELEVKVLYLRTAVSTLSDIYRKYVEETKNAIKKQQFICLMPYI